MHQAVVPKFTAVVVLLAGSSVVAGNLAGNLDLDEFDTNGQVTISRKRLLVPETTTRSCGCLRDRDWKKRHTGRITDCLLVVMTTSDRVLREKPVKGGAD